MKTSRGIAAGLFGTLAFLILGLLEPSEVKAQVSYTCDPSIGSSACNTLNTTIASLYNSTFTNADASIYITYGVTGLGESDQSTGTVTYSQYVNALAAQSGSGSGPVRTAALASLPTTEPSLYAGGDITLTSSLAQALGLGAVAGIPGTSATGSNCTLGQSGCYNAVVILDNPTDLAASTGGQGYYYRTGTFASNDYDFFSIVEHETDEVLGTASCIETQGTLSNGCGGSSPSAADLYRYSANGTRSLLSTNAAYFSFDGGKTNVAFYTHSANGEDFGDFDSSIYSCAHVQDAEGCLGKSLDITTDGGAEIQLLNAIGYDLAAPVPLPTSVILLLTGLGSLGFVMSRRPAALRVVSG
jgi:hypothetical protein